MVSTLFVFDVEVESHTVATDEYNTSVLFMRYLCNQTHASDIGSYCFQPSMCFLYAENIALLLHTQLRG